MFNKTMTYDEIRSLLDQLIEEWKLQFENSPTHSPVTFSLTDDGRICANGIVLFPAKDLLPTTLEYETESIYLGTVSGEVYEIGINWRVAGPPYMAFVHKISTLYIAP